MKRTIKKGATSVSLDLFIQDSASTTGAGKTGLAFNTASLTAYYHRPGAVAVAITLATQTVTGAFSSGGFVEIDATNMPGFYRLDIPDAAIASGVESVSVILKGASGMAPIPFEIELIAYDPQDAVRLGLTAIPNATAGANGGLPTGDANAAVKVQTGTGTGQLDFTSGVVKANLAQILGTALTETAGQIAAGFKKVFDVLTPVFTAASVNQTGDSFARIGAAGAGLTALGDTRIANLDTTVSSRTKPADTQAAVTLVTTTTNLTNAPTSGDLTATMKASVTTAASAATPAVTVSDKTGFSLSAAGVQAIWDALTSALTTVGSIGKLIVTNLDAAISSRTKPADTQAAVTLVTTVTNLTNAPTAGDLTATMKASVTTAATAATPSVTVSDKTGFSLSTAGILAIWHQLTAAIVTSSTIGKLIVDFLDAAVSSRTKPADTQAAVTLVTTTTNLTNAPTAGDLTSTMKASVTTAASAATPAVTVSNKTGFSLTSAYDPAKTAAQAGDAMALTSGERSTLAGVVWDYLSTAATTVGSLGKRIVDNLDALVSSRSTYAGGDTSGTTTLLGRLTSTRAGLIDNLDAAITSRLASSSYTAPLDAAGTRSAIGLASANLDTQLDAIPTAVENRQEMDSNSVMLTSIAIQANSANSQTTAGAIRTAVGLATASLDTKFAAIKSQTDLIPAAPAAVGDIPTASQNATAAWANGTRSLTDKANFTLTSDYDAAKTAAQEGDDMAVTFIAQTNIADTLLKRDMAAVTGEADRSPLNAFRAIRNKNNVAAGVLTVKKEDDSTTAWTATVTTDAAAEPITGVDPS